VISTQVPSVYLEFTSAPDPLSYQFVYLISAVHIESQGPSGRDVPTESAFSVIAMSGFWCVLRSFAVHRSYTMSALRDEHSARSTTSRLGGAELRKLRSVHRSAHFTLMKDMVIRVIVRFVCRPAGRHANQRAICGQYSVSLVHIENHHQQINNNRNQCNWSRLITAKSHSKSAPGHRTSRIPSSAHIYPNKVRPPQMIVGSRYRRVPRREPIGRVQYLDIQRQTRRFPHPILVISPY
jgi:hypothetical protein